MNIGTIKEVKDNENRVGLVPAGVKLLVESAHVVFVQRDAGLGAGFSNEEYERAGAILKDSPEEIVRAVDILVKVKEPISSEYSLLDLLKGKTLYTYLHLSVADRNLTLKLLENEITAVAYETVEDSEGELPLLAPMSQVAGVLAVQYGAQYLQKKYNGRGITMGHIDNTDLAETVVVGGGFVGSTSAKTALGMGGKVTILNRGQERLDRLEEEYRNYFGELFKNVTFQQSTDENLRTAVAKADLLVGAVLIHGAKAPVVVTEEMVKTMKEGAVIVDVSVDQGGCIWGTKPTTHSDPIYEIDGKIYCCVTNMPGQASRQATQALTGATFPYLQRMADQGVEEALRSDEYFAKGLNTYKGKVTYKSVADDLKLLGYFKIF